MKHKPETWDYSPTAQWRSVRFFGARIHTNNVCDAKQSGLAQYASWHGTFWERYWLTEVILITTWHQRPYSSETKTSIHLSKTNLTLLGLVGESLRDEVVCGLSRNIRSVCGGLYSFWDEPGGVLLSFGINFTTQGTLSPDPRNPTY